MIKKLLALFKRRPKVVTFPPKDGTKRIEFQLYNIRENVREDYYIIHLCNLPDEIEMFCSKKDKTDIGVLATSRGGKYTILRYEYDEQTKKELLKIIK